MGVIEQLATLRLRKGGHKTRAAGMSAMEAVAWLAGGPHSNHPRCVSHVLSNLIRPISNFLPDDKRQRLIPLLPRLIGTAGDAGRDQAWGFMLADWACRVILPLALDATGLPQEAANLRALAPLVDKKAVDAAAAYTYAADVAGFARAAGTYVVSNTYVAASGAAAAAAYGGSGVAAYAADVVVYAAYAVGQPIYDEIFRFLDRLLPVPATEGT